jgi:hypothetical protein
MLERHEQPKAASDELHPSIFIVSGVTMAVLTILLIWIGVHPNGMMVLIQQLLALD